MKKQTTTNYTALASAKNQFKESSKNISGKKTARYIYTEEDLGEGILDVGVTTLTGRRAELNSNNTSYKFL